MKGPDLEVLADRIVGTPCLEIDIDREAIDRYGIHIRQIQDVIEVAIGGKPLTATVEGRERYPVRVPYQREIRNSPQENEDVKRMWEERFERVYGHWRGFIDHAIRRYLDCGIEEAGVIHFY